MLTEQELNQIKEKAERLYPTTILLNGEEYFDHYYSSKQQAYIAAATLYQERINGLLEALESIIIYVDPIKFADPILNAKSVIANYNESLKG